MDNAHTPAKAGALGGSLLTLLLQIPCSELLRTVLLSASGAAVSFLVSYALQRLVKQKSKPKL